MKVGDVQSRMFDAQVEGLEDGEDTVIDARGMSNLTIITGDGATATVSRVDSLGAEAHTEGEENAETVAENTKLVIPVDWPFFRVSSADGPTRIGLT